MVSPIETVIGYDDSYTYPTYTYDYDGTYVYHNDGENVSKCDVSAALESVIVVGPSQSTTAPTDIAGWQLSRAVSPQESLGAADQPRRAGPHGADGSARARR